MYCDTGLGDVRLQKSQSVLLNRERYQCQNYFSTTFTKCAMKNMAKMLSEAAIECVTPYWNNFEELFNIPVCSNLNSTYGRKLNMQIAKVNGDFIREKINRDGCSKPCTLTKYNPTLMSFDKKAHMLLFGSQNADKNGLLPLIIYYISTGSEIKEQYFVYDFLTIISAVGGALGLLLGFSLLSIILIGISFFE